MKQICILPFVLLLFIKISTAQTWQPMGPSSFNQACYTYYPGFCSTAVGDDGTAYALSADSASTGLNLRKFDGTKWLTLNEQASGGNMSDFYKLVLGPNSTPYMIFRDFDRDKKATVMKFTGSAWDTVGKAGFTTGEVGDMAMAVDGNGTPYVACADYGIFERISVFKYDGSNWVNMNDTGIAITGNLSFMNYPSITFDGTNTPYLSYTIGYSSSAELYVRKYENGSWQTVGPRPFNRYPVIYPSITVSRAGVPHVVYTENDVNNNHKVSIKKFDGNTWQSVGQDGIAVDESAFDMQIAVDSAGTPYVAYASLDWQFKYPVQVKKYDGRNWVDVGTDRLSAGPASEVSLHIDRKGIPYVGYKTNYYNITAVVKKFVGGKWQTLGSSGFADGIAEYINAKVDGDGVPYVVFSDGQYDFKASVMKYKNRTWSTVGTKGFSAGVAEYTTLAIDQGTPYVAYRDSGNGGKATVMKYNGSSWVNVGNAGLSAGPVTYTSIAFDDSHTPYISYQDISNGGKATVMKYSGNNWVPVSGGAISRGNGGCPSMAIYRDTVYVLYVDDSNNVQPTVVRYYGNGWQALGTATINPSEGARYTALAIDSKGMPYAMYVNDLRAVILKYKNGKWIAAGHGSGVVSGPNTTSFALAVGDSDIPYIALSNSSTNYRVAVNRYNSKDDAWWRVGNSNFTAGESYVSSMAFNQDGTVYVLGSNGFAWGYQYHTKCHAAFTMYEDANTPHHWYALNEGGGVPPVTYTWSWGDGTSSAGATPSHVYADPGYYQICLNVTDSIGCTSSYCDSSTYIRSADGFLISVDVVTEILAISTGVLETETGNYSFSIYPNPAATNFTLETTYTGMQQLKLYNMAGQLVWSEQIQNSKTAINTANLSAGIYILTLQTTAGLVAKKLVVDK